MKNELLHQERLRRSWSQQQLADFAEVSLSTVARAERGEAIRVDNIQRLCECLAKTPEELGLLESLFEGTKETGIDLDAGGTMRPIQVFVPADIPLITVQIHQPPNNITQDARLEEDEERSSKKRLSFEPRPYPYLSASHLQKSAGNNAMILRTARFLELTIDELLQRYANEKLLRIKVKGQEWELPQVCIFDNSASRIPMSAITVVRDTLAPLYAIPAKIEAKARDVLQEIGHQFHDSTTIRLNGIAQKDGQIILTISKAHYLDYIGTNYAMDALLSERGWTKTLRDSVNPGKELEPLETSLLANHIGVGVLAFTSDNYLILPVRSNDKVGIWQQQMSPSISGAASYDDDMWAAQSGPVAAWMREGREELGLENGDFEQSVFLGITRELLRGGKPEIFFTTQLGITKSEVEHKFAKARDRWENREVRWFEFTAPLTPPTTQEGLEVFLREFSDLVEQFQNILSQPLLANLVLWFKYMTAMPAANEITA